MFSRLNRLFFSVSNFDELRLRYVQTLSTGIIVLAVIGALLTLAFNASSENMPILAVFAAVAAACLYLANTDRIELASYVLVLLVGAGIFIFGVDTLLFTATLTVITVGVLMPSFVFYTVVAAITFTFVVLVASVSSVESEATLLDDSISQLLTVLTVAVTTRYLVNIGGRALLNSSRSVSALQTATTIGQEIASVLDIDSLIHQVARSLRARFELEEVRIEITDSSGLQHTVKLGVTLPNTPLVSFPIQLTGEDSTIYTAGQLRVGAYHALTPAETQALQVVTDLVAAGVQNALSFAQQNATLRENERLYASSQSNLAEIERLNQELTRAAWNEFATASTPFKGVLADGDKLIPLMDEAETLPSGTLSVPVMLRGEVIGVIEVEPGKDNTLEAAELAQAVAQRLALSLEAARLYEESRLAATQEQLINTIAARYQSVSTVDELLRITVEELSSMLGAQRASIRLARLDPAPAAHVTGSTNGTNGSKAQ